MANRGMLPKFRPAPLGERAIRPAIRPVKPTAPPLPPSPPRRFSSGIHSQYDQAASQDPPELELDPISDPPTMAPQERFHGLARERPRSQLADEETRGRSIEERGPFANSWSPDHRSDVDVPYDAPASSAAESDDRYTIPSPEPASTYVSDPATQNRNDEAEGSPHARAWGADAPSYADPARRSEHRDDYREASSFSEPPPPARRFKRTVGYPGMPAEDSYHPGGDVESSPAQGSHYEPASDANYREPDPNDHSQDARPYARAHDPELGFRATEHASRAGYLPASEPPRRGARDDLEPDAPETHYPTKGQRPDVGRATRDENQMLREQRAEASPRREERRATYRDEPREEPRDEPRHANGAAPKHESYPPHREAYAPQAHAAPAPREIRGLANFVVGVQPLRAGAMAPGASFVGGGTLGSLGGESFGLPQYPPHMGQQLPRTPQMGIPYSPPPIHRPMTPRGGQPMHGRVPTNRPQHPIGHQVQMPEGDDGQLGSKVGRFAWFVFGSAFGIFFAFFATGFVPYLGKKDEPAPPPPPPVAQVAAQQQQPVVQAPPLGVAPAPFLLAPPPPQQQMPNQALAARPLPAQPQFAGAPPMAQPPFAPPPVAQPIAQPQYAQAPAAPASKPAPPPAPARGQRTSAVARRAPTAAAPRGATDADDDGAMRTREKPAAKEKADIGDLLNAGLAP